MAAHLQLDVTVGCVCRASASSEALLKPGKLEQGSVAVVHLVRERGGRDVYEMCGLQRGVWGREALQVIQRGCQRLRVRADAGRLVPPHQPHLAQGTWCRVVSID